jgi:hypothetical protein
MRALISFLVAVLAGCAAPEESVLDRLAAIEGVEAQRLTLENPMLEEFELKVRQPVDHRAPVLDAFDQRVQVQHRGFDRPTVLITEGYHLGDNQIAELAEMLEANQVRVEHRYAGDSVPDQLVWDLLTVEQAAGDAHRVVELLKPLYPGPWLNAGWSKGGQAAVFHRFFYPDDVVGTVAYDAPLPRSLEDERLDYFFSSVGSESCREALQEFQRAVLEAREQILPRFRWWAAGKEMRLSVGDERVLEYAVLEFPFSFWQYTDADCGRLPGPGSDPDLLLARLLEVVGIGWYSDDSLDSPSFHQFCTELGYYGYQTDHLRDLLREPDYPNCRWAPAWPAIEFDPEPTRRLAEWLQTEAERIMTLYGAVDPWSAPAMPFNEGLDQHQIWLHGGNHFTFISSLDGDDADEAVATLRRWLAGEPPMEEAP